MTQLVSAMDYVLIDIMISFFILFPFILIIFYIYRSIKLRYFKATKKLEAPSYVTDDDDNEEREIEAVITGQQRTCTMMNMNVDKEVEMAQIDTEHHLNVSLQITAKTDGADRTDSDGEDSEVP